MARYQTESRGPSIALASAAFVLGLLSFCVPGAFIGALICGALARRYAWADPQRYGGYGIATIGFWLGGITLLLQCVALGIWWMIIQSAAVELSRKVAAQQKMNEIIQSRHLTVDRARRVLKESLEHALRDQDGRLPERLAVLVPAKLGARDLLSTETATPTFSLPSELKDWRLYADDVDRGSDFIYIGGELKRGKGEPGYLIVLYSKANGLGGRAVATLDNTTQWVSDERIGEYIDRNNEAREQLNLGRLALDSRTPEMLRSRAGGSPGVGAGGGGGGTIIGRGGNSNLPEVPKTSFASVEEAFSYLSSEKQEEVRAAWAYLGRATPAAAWHDRVLFKLEPLLVDAAMHTAGFVALRAWATESDLPLIRTSLEKMAQNPQSADSADARILVALAGKFKDHESSNSVVLLLKNASVRAAALEMLSGLGAEAEPALLPLTMDGDSEIAKGAIGLIAKVGTEKSILPLHRAMYVKTESVPAAAQDALKQVADRLSLKPEQYQMRLLEHFFVEGPPGFVEDKGSAFNSRQWSRKAPGRAVSSTFLVEVKWVEKNFKLEVPAGANSLAVNGMTLYLLASGGNNITRSVRWGAVDGEYLLLVTGTVDGADQTAIANIQNAVNKIRVK